MNSEEQHYLFTQRQTFKPNFNHQRDVSNAVRKLEMESNVLLR